MDSFGKMEATKSVTFAYEETTGLNTGWPKSLCDLFFTVPTQCIRAILTQLMSWWFLSQKTFRTWTVLYWTRSSRTHFGVSINVWRLAGDTLNITCNFLYCNHQVYWDFLITLYISCRRLEVLSGLITFKPRYNVTSFIVHTTLWTESTSLTLSRFSTANCSEETVEILNPPFIMCGAVDCAHVALRTCKCASRAVKVVLKVMGFVQQEEPISIIWKL